MWNITVGKQVVVMWLRVGFLGSGSGQVEVVVGKVVVGKVVVGKVVMGKRVVGVWWACWVVVVGESVGKRRW
jgi:hypothetical protein